MSGAEAGMQRPLRIGLLIDDVSVPAWFHLMVKDLAASNYAELALVVINDNDIEVPVNKTLASKIANNRGRLVYLAVRKALEVAYSGLIERHTHLPDAEAMMDATAILEHDIDLLIRGGFGILRGDILNVTRFGVWSFHHGDNLRNRGGPAGFWESMQRWPETGSVLQILTEDLDNGAILYRSFSCTDSLSVKDNKSNYYWKTQAFMGRKLKELHYLGESAFFEKVAHENRHLNFYSERLYTA